jgi:transposase-like protein
VPRYSEERKEVVLRKMLPPHNRSLKALALEEGISEATLYNWRRRARAQGRLLPDADAGPEAFSAADKFAAVVETAALNEAELGEYCRKRGLYPEQIRAWRAACEQANAWEDSRARQARGEEAEQRRRIRELERELRHKEKALAETAALLVLRKKAAAIWGEDEDA